jgi:hypothetical protein
MATDRRGQVPSHTGSMRLDKDGIIRGILSDVFNAPINFEATKEGKEYRLIGWRGAAPEFRRIPIAESARDDGLPDSAPHGPCPTCEGKLYWRAALTDGVWNCATCVPYDSLALLDGVCVGAK